MGEASLRTHPSCVGQAGQGDSVEVGLPPEERAGEKELLKTCVSLLTEQLGTDCIWHVQHSSRSPGDCGQ